MSKLNSIESLMDGYNPQRQLLEQTRQLVVVVKTPPQILARNYNRRKH